jgi:hypothetical protein
MRGIIHGIWLTQPGGTLHAQIIPNLSSWAKDATQADFSILLWTNLNELAPQEVARLQAANIVAVDYSACKASPIYKYFVHFLDLGIKGDKSAFALASDILRMAILDLTQNDKYFIYIDPNDITLLNLHASLKNLDLLMSHNKFGFTFGIEALLYEKNNFEIRNDVLIALKQQNTGFFKAYLSAYLTHIDNKYTSYVKPITDIQAQQQAALISNQVSTEFFKISGFTDNSIRVVTKFANYTELYTVVNSGAYLNSQRNMLFGNTWLPIGDLKEEWAELAKYGVFAENSVAASQYTANAGPVIPSAAVQVPTTSYKQQSLANHSKVAGYGLVFALLLVTMIFWRKIRA